MDKKINVVTGATGHIGVALCVELKRRGEYVRALHRNGSPAVAVLEKIADEILYCDVTNKDELSEAFKGADTVFHLAGIIAIQSKLTEEVRNVNVQGTKNVCEACLEHNIRKLVYTSSVHALSFKNNKEILTEPDRYDPSKVHGGYAKSKAEASNVVLDFAANGLDATLALPSGVIGQYEYRRSNFGQMVADVCDRKLPAIVTGRYDFVDVTDVALALIDLRDKGAKGESYILSGHIMTVRELANAAAKGAGVKAPKLCFPNFLVRWVAKLIEKRAEKKGHMPMFTPYSMKVLKDNCNFSHEKITALTGYAPRELEEPLKEQAQFYINITKKAAKK